MGSETGKSVVELLGLDAQAKALIVTCDEFGLCHSHNAATMDTLEHGLATSATLTMPCPWVMEAVEYARSHPQGDFGVHLVLTCESRRMRWRPLSSRAEAPGLYDPEGYMWRTGAQVWEHATEDEVERECRAQIEMALGLGIDVTHLDPHDGIFPGDVERFGRLYLRLGERYDLPLRMNSQAGVEAWGHPELRRRVAAKGILQSDDWIGSKRPDESQKDFYVRRLRELQPGVTDFWIHPTLQSEEFRAKGGPAAYVEDHRLFTADPDIARTVEEQGIVRIGWRAIRDAQRARTPR
ncbi:MAG: polysaccharide deacetylase family protein [Chloroflexi bacterium]|nr:polysaccharide deacetylase family protein [Chloroflexota bacterium]